MITKFYKLALLSLLTITSSASFAATQDAACSTATVLGGNALQFYHPGFTAQLPTDGSGYPAPGGEGAGIRVCHHSNPPTLDQTETCDVAATESSGTHYASIYVAGTDSSCIFSYEISAADNSRSTPAVVAATPPPVQAVPIFSPLGLLLMLSGLLLYGRRKRSNSMT